MHEENPLNPPLRKREIFGGGIDQARFSYSGHQVALGRSGRRQALRQFHLQLSQSSTLIPSHFFRPITNLPHGPGPVLALILISVYQTFFIPSNKTEGHTL
jgi:hypothetical protein